MADDHVIEEIEEEAVDPSEEWRPITQEMKAIHIPWIVIAMQKVHFIFIWECMMIIILIVLFWITTYIAFFSYYDPNTWILVQMIEVIFAIDVVLRLSVEIWRSVSHARCQIFILQYSFWQFMEDLIALFPFAPLFVEIVGTNSFSYLNVVFFLRFNRFIRLSRGFQLFKCLESNGGENETLVHLARYLYEYTIMVQLFACVTYALNGVFYIDWMLGRAARTVDDPVDGHWLQLRSYNALFQDTLQPEAIDLYYLTIDYVVAIVTTVGYGDLYAVHNHDLIVAVFIMLVGSIVIEGILSDIMTELHLSVDTARFDLFYRLDGIERYMKTIRAPRAYIDKVKEYYNELWNFRQGVHDVNLKDLPQSLQEEVMYDICEEMLEKTPLFRGLEPATLQSISRLAKVQLFIPEVIIVREGEYSTDMRYVIQGELGVRGKVDPENTALIMRPGSIMGEINLLYSFPAFSSVETINTCQILTISKSEFVKAMEKHPLDLEVIRRRLNDRLYSLVSNYRMVGFKHVAWVQRIGPDSTSSLEVTLRDSRNRVCNQKVRQDIRDDSAGTYIVNMKCPDPNKTKDHFACYRSCNIENIFRDNRVWVKGWQAFILSNAVILGTMLPYCSAFDNPADPDDSMYCQIFADYSLIAYTAFVLDLLFEIYGATPSAGIYYRFRDGLRVCLAKPFFWFDVLAVFPYGIFSGSIQSVTHTNEAIRAFFKTAKVFRFICHMDNVFPLRLFTVRMVKALVVVSYGSHLLACLFFRFVCNQGAGIKCNRDTWLSSHQRTEVNPITAMGVHEMVLMQKMPYLISLWFACATLTSAGYGDFTPQRRIEVISCIVAMVIGVFLISYIIGGLAAALTCGVRPQILFQQRLFAIRSFLEHHSLSTRIKARIIEHYDLQNKLLRGICLPKNARTLLYDAPEVVVDDTLLWEVELFLEGVPIFTKCDSQVMTRMAKRMKLYLIPPNVTYVDRGEVRRSMSIVYKGSVGMYTTEGVEVGILESTSHFGIRDLLFGEPHEYFIKTKSYCMLYSIDFQSFIDSFEGYDQQMMEMLHAEKLRLHNAINHLVFLRGFQTDQYNKSDEKPVEIQSFIPFPCCWNKMKCSRCTYEEYVQIFSDIPRLSWLYRLLLMPYTVHPCGLFAKLWTAWISFVCMLIITCASVEFFMQFRQPWFKIFQFLLDTFNWMDIYVKLHWCYYGDRKHLISHPAKTAYHYMFYGMFVYDIAFAGGLESIILAYLQGGDMMGLGPGSNWFTKIRMTRCLQIYKIPELFNLVHNVFANRTMLLCVFYCIVLFCLTTVMGAMAVFIACPWFPRDWTPGDEYRMPACLTASWISKDILIVDETSILQRWVISIYYIFQAILTVGFGEIVTLQQSELEFLLLTTIIGFLLMQVIIADIMAAQIDTDENRATFLEQRTCLLWCLKRESVPKKIVKMTEEHLSLKWEASRGLQPQEIFEDLHPALAADLFQEFVGDSLINVPLFRSFSIQVLRSMAMLLKKEYFVEGERITRAGNLEFEMFVIAEGRVHMLDGHGKYMTTLKKNDFFGEISMLFGKPRRHSAVAASKVELFVLNADDFAELIDKYPAVKDEILDILRNDKQEVFVKNYLRKQNKDMGKWTKKAQILNDLIGRTLKSREVGPSSIRKKGRKRTFGFTRWIIGWGTEDLKLPFLYFANSSQHNWRFKLLIHPKCMFWRILDTTAHYCYFLSTMLSLYVAFFVTHFFMRTDIPMASVFRIFKKDHLTQLTLHAGRMMELLILLHILLKCIVPFQISYNNYCKDWGRIVFRYLTDPAGFILDAIGMVHIDLIVFAGDFPSRHPYVEYLAFIQLVRLIRFYLNILESKHDLGQSTLLYKMAISWSMFLFLGHALACILYWAAVPFGKVSEHSWVQRVEGTFVGKVSEDDLDKLRLPSAWYLRSLYFMMTILTSCGFGDNIPQSFIEYIIVCITMLFGAIGTAIALGNLSTGLQALNRAKREYYYKINTQIKHLLSIGLNPESANIMLAYFNRLWEVGRGQPYHKATAILPLTMQFDYCSLLFGETIMNCTIFGKILDESFVRNVAVRLVHCAYPPGVSIVNQTESGSGFYVVYKGTVISYIIDEEDKILFKQTYDKFKCFGQVTCFFKNMSYPKTYRAETKVETLYLDQTHVKQLTQYYPLWKEYLLYLIDENYVEYKLAGMKHIFTPDEEADEDITEIPLVHPLIKPKTLAEGHILKTGLD